MAISILFNFQQKPQNLALFVVGVVGVVEKLKNYAESYDIDCESLWW